MHIVLETNDDAFVDQVRGIAPEATVLHAVGEAQLVDMMAGAEVFYGIITPPMLAAARSLSWIQMDHTGLEEIMFPQLVEHPVLVTNTRGIHTDSVAEHAVALLLAICRVLPQRLRDQEQRHWRDYQGGPPHLLLSEATVGIVGLGFIGTGVAERLAPFGARVVATDARTTDPPAGIAALYGADELHRMIADTDAVVICAPETPETRGMFDAATFTAMKPGVLLVNVGRGAVVDLHALADALTSGRVAWAGLDVFETEPLPPDHPLWDLPNVLITPHCAVYPAPYARRSQELFLQNLERFLAGETPDNIVDKKRWF